MQNGSSQSCGCLNREISTKHGKSTTREYKAWSNMIIRCTKQKENEEKYSDVEVCQRWLDSFENFYEDMGDCPSGFEIDRINSDGNYCKENCRWVSEQVQAENRRKFKNNTSGKTGVTWSKQHNKWRVVLQSNKIRYSGGLYESYDAAVAARKKLEIDILGSCKYE